MPEDQELSAMKVVFAAMEPLEQDARVRVFAWVSERLSIAPPSAPLQPSGGASRADGTQSQQPQGHFSEFHSLYDAATPKTTDMALVAGYWLQVCQGQPDFSSLQANEELKQLGHPLSNIALAFTRLQGQTPVLARQIQTSGKGAGRKKYRVTQEGIVRVEAMVTGKE